MKTVEDRVKNVVCEQLGLKNGEVANAANFVDDLGADSLDVVELVMALEEEFETEITDDDAHQLQTVQSIIDYVEKQQAA